MDDNVVSLEKAKEILDNGLDQAKNVLKSNEQLNDLMTEIDDGDVEKVFMADDNFHEAISTAAHNSLLGQIAKLVRTLTSELRMNIIRNMLKIGRGNELKKAHEDLFKVVKYKNDDAARKMLVEGYFYRYNALLK